MQKLLNLAKKIAPTIKASTSATGVYYYIKNDKFLKPIEKALNAKEIVYLTFLIQGYKEGRDLQDILQRCERDLFSFSTINLKKRLLNSNLYRHFLVSLFENFE